MRIVLFLGAGFSKEFKLPVMNEFFAFADSSRKLDDQEKKLLNRLVLDARRANSFLQSSPTNVEDILSFCVMNDRLLLNEDQDMSNQDWQQRKTTIDCMKMILQKIYTDNMTNIKDFWSNMNKFKPFLGFHPSQDPGHQVTIITTNYDICIECALYRLKSQTDPGFDFEQIDYRKDINTRDQLYSRNGVPVYKLHGSVNWYTDADPSKFKVEGRVLYNTVDEQLFPAVGATDFKYEEVPMIVPPSFLKPDFEGPLKKIWAGAAQSLLKANILIFVGYSFPLSDVDMMYFLASALTDNPSLRKIVIIDPMAEDILHKIQSIESKFGSHFKGLLEIEPLGWASAQLRNRL